MWISDKRLREIIRQEIRELKNPLTIMQAAVKENPLGENKDNSPMGPGEKRG